MQYFQGNLALDPKRAERKTAQQAPRQAAAKQQAVHAPSMSARTKLSRLAAVVFVVCVAVFIMGRYTQIYQYNLDLRDMQRNYNELQAENSALKQQSETMKSPERLKAKAEEWGFVPPNQQPASQVAAASKTANTKDTGSKTVAKATKPNTSNTASQKTGTGKDAGQAAAAKR